MFLLCGFYPFTIRGGTGGRCGSGSSCSVRFAHHRFRCEPLSHIYIAEMTVCEL